MRGSDIGDFWEQCCDKCFLRVVAQSVPPKSYIYIQIWFSNTTLPSAFVELSFKFLSTLSRYLLYHSNLFVFIALNIFFPQWVFKQNAEIFLANCWHSINFRSKFLSCIFWVSKNVLSLLFETVSLSMQLAIFLLFWSAPLSLFPCTNKWPRSILFHR